MPRVYSALDRLTVPPVTFDRWESQGAPWFNDIDHLPIDLERTTRLTEIDLDVRTGASTPLQRASTRRTTVVTFNKGWPTGSHLVPLPDVVWLLRNGDDQWFGFNDTHYWEVSALGPTFWPWWRADGVRVYDLSKPWTQRQGLAGGGVPIWALTPTPQELDLGGGGVRHSLALSLAGNYSKDKAPGTLKTDGTLADHPLRSGELLRLTDLAYRRRLQEASNAHTRAVVVALRRKGARVNDKTAPDSHALRLPVGAQVNLKLRMTDFEVVAA